MTRPTWPHWDTHGRAPETGRSQPVVHVPEQHTGPRINEHVRTLEYAARTGHVLERAHCRAGCWRITQTLKG